mgnify:CR=1 FL=1
MIKKIFIILVGLFLFSFLTTKCEAACWTGDCNAKHDGDYKCNNSYIWWCDSARAGLPTERAQ